MNPRGLESLATIAAMLLMHAGTASAGAPSLTERCQVDKRDVSPRYDATATRYFAEARRSGNVMEIVVNPTIYYLGQRTQQWLFLRQCVHLKMNHEIVLGGERALRIEQELEADCQAMRDLAGSATAKEAIGSSPRTLRVSIESDMERLLRDKQWSAVLPGPQRRISFDKCAL